MLALFVIGALASVFPWNHRSVAVGSFTVIAVLVAVQTLLTPQATAGWHYVSVYPFVTIVAAYGVYAVARAILRRGTAVYVALGCAAAGALVYDGALMSTYMRTLASKEPTNAGWTPAIYQLSRVIRHTPGTIFTADWGISNPLFTLQPSLRYGEVAFDLSSPTSQSLDRLDKLIASTPGPKLFVTHAAGKVQLSGVNQNLFRALGGHLRFAGSVPGRDGKPVFVLYDYR
jgi:hypothetical protein